MDQPTAQTATTPALDHARPGLVVHGALRRELRLAGPLVRRVAGGDTDRAAVVGRHLDLVLRMLHHHHEGEDEGVWPPLRARAGASVAPLLDVMDRQHERIGELTARCEARLAPWMRTAATDDGEQLAADLDELHAVLADHLEVEERDLFGLAEQHLTVQEWQAIGAKAEAAFAGKERALVFGMFQYEGDPETLVAMLAAAPAPVRFLVPRLARRAYRRHAAAIHGTPTP